MSEDGRAVGLWVLANMAKQGHQVKITSGLRLDGDCGLLKAWVPT